MPERFLLQFSANKKIFAAYILWEIQHAPPLDNMAGNITEIAKEGCLMKSTVLIAAAIIITTMCSIQPVRGEEKAVVFYDTDQRQLMASLNMGDMAVKNLVYVVSRLTGENFVINGEIADKKIALNAQKDVPLMKYNSLGIALTTILASNGLAEIHDQQMTMVVPVQQSDALTKIVMKRQKMSSQEEKVSLELDKVRLPYFTKLVGRLTGEEYIVSDKVKNTQIVVMTPDKLSTGALRDVTELILNANGLSAKPAGDKVEVVPLRIEATAK